MTFRKNKFNKLLSAGMLIFLSACAGTSYNNVYPTLSDGKYDSEFPYRNCSGQLEDIAGSLAKLDVLVFYKTYTFLRGQQVDMEQVRKSKAPLSEMAASTDIFSESAGGTAITIQYSENHIVFLSCAHIVDYPDTVISYYPYPDDAYIQVLGIKARQQNSIGIVPPGDELSILAIDRKADIVLLGSEVGGEKQPGIRLFSYPLGDSKELEWGSFVYIMGFPMGHAMITRGIVSDPGRIQKGSFLIDAVFNKGFSGGPVIAVRDGVPNFEMVGMVKSSAATNRYYLAPRDAGNAAELNLAEPYEGELQLVREKDIKYGITFSVTTGVLRSFFMENKEKLERQGYFLENFFIPGK